jgi:uracil-DNA glycosylase family 4
MNSSLIADPVDNPGTVAPEAGSFAELDSLIARCTACPRLVEHREEVARVKRAAYRDEGYWGRPVPGLGPSTASIALVGLAPAAHGGNRTGRMFTGDRSGDVLFQGLYDVGLASQPTSRARNDGLVLSHIRITAPVRCAPPSNKPTPAERDTCRPWLVRELELLRPTLRVAVVLGAFGWQALLAVLSDSAWDVPTPRPKFTHGAHTVLPANNGDHPLNLLGCYHVSQQNTFTGKLSPAMLREVLEQAKELAGVR